MTVKMKTICNISGSPYRLPAEAFPNLVDRVIQPGEAVEVVDKFVKSATFKEREALGTLALGAAPTADNSRDEIAALKAKLAKAASTDDGKLLEENKALRNNIEGFKNEIAELTAVIDELTAADEAA